MEGPGLKLEAHRSGAWAVATDYATSRRLEKGRDEGQMRAFEG